MATPGDGSRLERLAFGLGARAVDSVDELFSVGLALVLEEGHLVDTAQAFREVLNQQLVLLNPRARVLSPGRTSFSLRVAIARVVWHLAASDDLEHIAFYEPRARRFSDDCKSVPGSSIGARLFGKQSGVDQFRGALSRLKEDPATRRATAIVWNPVDSVRVSNDIPCTLGFSLHLRDGMLSMSSIMRSNNALRLLPYNVFELSLLGELAAAAVGVDLGPYGHFAQSLHVFEEERTRAIEALKVPPDRRSLIMPSLPSSPDPLDQAELLVSYERSYRKAALAGDATRRVLADASDDLSPFWFALLTVLATKGVGGEPLPEMISVALDALDETHPFRSHVDRNRSIPYM